MINSYSPQIMINLLDSHLIFSKFQENQLQVYKSKTSRGLTQFQENKDQYLNIILCLNNSLWKLKSYLKVIILKFAKMIILLRESLKASFRREFQLSEVEIKSLKLKRMRNNILDLNCQFKIKRDTKEYKCKSLVKNKMVMRVSVL